MQLGNYTIPPVLFTGMHLISYKFIY